MRVKHFSNDANAIVKASLRSLPLVNPAVLYDEASNTIFNRVSEGSAKVRIISGGGAGHEPSFSGFCGEGGLTAAVSGNVFASPTSRQVLNAIERVQSPAGVLVTVMNYTGDVLNFGVAVEKARARNPSLLVKMLIVGDDCSVPKSQGGKVGNRGIAGTVLVHKITCAAANTGCSFDEVYEIGQITSQYLASIGASLDRVHVPGQAVSDAAALEVDQVELGMGIHNERGVSRLQGVDAQLSQVVEAMIAKLLAAVSVNSGDTIIVLVNNLGGLSVLELGAVVSEVNQQLKEQHGINAARMFAGTFMTSLDGPGFSISLLNASGTGRSEVVLKFLDAPIDVPGWVSSRHGDIWKAITSSSDGAFGSLSEPEVTPRPKGERSADPQVDIIVQRLRAAMNAVVNVEPEVTRYDQIVGDGDCGTTLRRGAEGILKMLSNGPQTVVDLLEAISSTIEDTMDGTSGALYAIFFNAMTMHFKQSKPQPEALLNVGTWLDALEHAISSLRQYTPAAVGDRTMMDALLPFLETLRETQDIEAAATAATDGADKTRFLKASLGRTVYVGGEDEWLGKVPDPGAFGLAALLRGLAYNF